jgi:hypothetical protein
VNRSPVTAIFGLLLVGSFMACQDNKTANPMSQNPSPMVEYIRPHVRISAENCPGERQQWMLDGKSVQLFIPNEFTGDSCHLVIHFHGQAEVSEFAVCGESSQVMVTINGGTGGSSYEKVFAGGKNFPELLSTIRNKIGLDRFRSVTLSGWSAGYGAIRAILSYNDSLVDHVILLDGLHASYIPERTVMSAGGRIDSTDLAPFLNFAEEAVSGRKKLFITHTSIFPGTYASTTECTQYIINQLGLKRMPILKSGPVGMQQVGEVKTGNLAILSYAGNTAPDHIDHLHGLGYFLDYLFSY